MPDTFLGIPLPIVVLDCLLWVVSIIGALGIYSDYAGADSANGYSLECRRKMARWVLAATLFGWATVPIVLLLVLTKVLYEGAKLLSSVGSDLKADCKDSVRLIGERSKAHLIRDEQTGQLSTAPDLPTTGALSISKEKR